MRLEKERSEKLIREREGGDGERKRESLLTRIPTIAFPFGELDQHQSSSPMGDADLLRLEEIDRPSSDRRRSITDGEDMRRRRPTTPLS
ncbi:hypothetical protein Ddye_024234 [Dipteronia dyeriana]|uniref:Uncharacterized protein n=1 Tax=Dipteronia dyeriana TaxID=168575 RepID=A0AAD9TV20_9ROSI|nr:hypothetical protein Ddye_024234 [Dipteronia dyeriana]